MTKTAKVQLKLKEFSDIEFINIVNNSFSYSEILRKIGLSTNGGSSTISIKRRISNLNLNISHFKRNGSPYNIVKKIIPLETVLVENSTYSRRSLKHRLIKNGILKYECQICLIDSWNDKLIVLQLDHINGINNDNRIENLRLICPNCHSQTENYSGKNKKIGQGLGDQM